MAGHPPMTKPMSNNALHPPTLVLTQGLRLDPVRIADTPELFALTRHNIEHLRCWLSWTDRINRAADTREYIRMMQRFAREGTGFACAIRQEGRIVGIIDMHHVDLVNRHASIGYWVSADAQGRGIMTAACRAIVQWGFETRELHRIEIRVAEGNHRSSAIPTRLGFTTEGVCREVEWLGGRWVNHEIFSMLLAEWRHAGG